MKYNPKYLENRIQFTMELINILFKEKIITYTEYDNLHELLDKKTEELLKKQKED